MQTDDGVVGATSFVSLDEANNFYRSHLYDDYWNTMSDDLKMRALNSATLFLNSSYIFKGIPKDREQRLQFPRRIPGYYIDGTCTSNYIIPEEVKKATILFAENLSRSKNKFVDNATANISESKLGELETKFSGRVNPIVPHYIYRIIRSLVDCG